MNEDNTRPSLHDLIEEGIRIHTNPESPERRVCEALREAWTEAREFLEADQEDKISYWQNRFFELLEKWDEHE